jgi:hypothetical protein
MKAAIFDPDRAQWLMDSVVGRWAGDRIAIIGYYCEDEDANGLVGREGSPWGEDGEKWTDVSELVIEAMMMDWYHHTGEKAKARAEAMERRKAWERK